MYKALTSLQENKYITKIASSGLENVSWNKEFLILSKYKNQHPLNSILGSNITYNNFNYNNTYNPDRFQYYIHILGFKITNFNKGELYQQDLTNYNGPYILEYRIGTNGMTPFLQSLLPNTPLIKYNKNFNLLFDKLIQIIENKQTEQIEDILDDIELIHNFLYNDLDFNDSNVKETIKQMHNDTIPNLIAKENFLQNYFDDSHLLFSYVNPESSDKILDLQCNIVNNDFKEMLQNLPKEGSIETGVVAFQTFQITSEALKTTQGIICGVNLMLSEYDINNNLKDYKTFYSKGSRKTRDDFSNKENTNKPKSGFKR